MSNKIKLFCLSRYYPHKNLELILEAWEGFPDALSDFAVLLTIAPDQHPGAAKLLRRIERLGLGDRIVNVGPLEQRQLPAFLLLPTLLESFTATYVEAMHFGLPIITSDLDFAHTVCGDAVMYFNPWSVEALRDTLLRFKNDPQLAGILVDRGRARSQPQTKTWDKIAFTLSAELEQLVALA